jgi:lipopolysaccharide/colanic/teichoic acid biosynthesis glycosyltransferase
VDQCIRTHATGNVLETDKPSASRDPFHLAFSELPTKKRLAIRILDVLLSSLALIFSIPVIILISAFIVVFDGWPIFFKQVRVGLGLRDLTIVKFRTMIVGAEGFQDQILRTVNEPNVQIKADDRVTPLGRVLRRLSLDEIPQILLVLSGKMSLVGPRPLIKEEVLQLPSKYLNRFQVPPGITGLAQVSGRARLSIWTILDLDLRWAEEYSFRLYLKILWKTFSALLRTEESC